MQDLNIELQAGPAASSPSSNATPAAFDSEETAALASVRRTAGHFSETKLRGTQKDASLVRGDDGRSVAADKAIKRGMSQQQAAPVVALFKQMLRQFRLWGR